MLENIISKKIEELEKEKYKMDIPAQRLMNIDIELKQYRAMLKGLKEQNK